MVVANKLCDKILLCTAIYTLSSTIQHYALVHMHSCTYFGNWIHSCTTIFTPLHACTCTKPYLHLHLHRTWTSFKRQSKKPSNKKQASKKRRNGICICVYYFECVCFFFCTNTSYIFNHYTTRKNNLFVFTYYSCSHITLIHKGIGYSLQFYLCNLAKHYEK